MRIIYTLVFTLAVFFNYIERSSQSDSDPDSNRDPGASSSTRHHSPDRNSTAEPPPRCNSRFPAVRTPPTEVLGYSLGKLGYIRLIPRTNQGLTFEFRNFIFPAGIPIRWRSDGVRVSLVELQKHIVLSTSGGDILAILANSGSLSGILKSQRGYPRVKLNMISGAVHHLTPDEMRDCPVGRNNPIYPHNFFKAWSNYDSLDSEWNSDGKRTPGSSSSRKQSPERSPTPQEFLSRERSKSPPIQPPSDAVLGYTMQQLGYVRLIPLTNQNQQLEFRRYIFPANKPIRTMKDMITYVFRPNTEHIVVSKSNGDVFAILDQSGTLRGIYRTGKGHSRVKMNMISGAVDDITPDEKRYCPLGNSHPIFPNSFIRACSNSDSLQFTWNPNGERTPYISPPTIQNSPERTPCREPPPDVRSRSPPGRPPSHEVLGYSLEKLGYIRLIPQNNPNRQFEFRKYIFPASKGIHLKIGLGKFEPVPTREHIVLSTSNGDVFAILEYTGILRGTYRLDRRSNWKYSRIKINMMSDEVDYMTEFEMKECHVGKSYPIFPRWFDKIVSNEDSLHKIHD